MSKQTPDEDERGSLARPPWLPGEKQRRRVQLGRGNRREDADERRADKGKKVADRLAGGAEDTPGPAKRERVPVVRHRPEAEPGSTSTPADDSPESRPKRVAVPFDPIRRLQQMEPEPVAPVSELPVEPEHPAPDVPMAEVADASPVEEPEPPPAVEPSPAAEEPLPDTDESPPAAELYSDAEASPESVEWAPEALTRLEWQYDSLLAESLVIPEAAVEVAGEPESEAVVEAPTTIDAGNQADSEPEHPDMVQEPEPPADVVAGPERPVHPQYSVEPVAPVEVSDFDIERDVELPEEPELPAELEPAVEDSTEPEWFSELLVEPERAPEPVEAESFEPVPVSTERLWEPRVSTEPEPTVEVSEEPEWVCELAEESDSAAEPVDAERVEQPPAELEPVPVSTERLWEPPPPEPEPPVVVDVESETPADESEPAELDEIELRAAALLEQMAVKRAQATMAPQESEVQPITDDPADAAASDRPPAESTNDAEAEAVSSAHDEPDLEPISDEAPTDDAVPTQWLPTDLVGGAAAPEYSPVNDPDIVSPPDPVTADEQADDAVVTQAESLLPQQGTGAAPAAEQRSKGPRRPAQPPWQTPSSAMAAEIEEVVLDVPVPQHEPAPAPEQHQPPTPHGPSASSPQPPVQTRKRPRPSGRPPWPPPPPPGPFPPPPWWPGPPPGQGLPPKARPAASAQPPRAPQPVPPPGRPQPPLGGPPQGYQPFRVPPSIDEAEITNPDRFAPPSGWRRAVHKATGGHVNPGASRKERQQDHLLAEIRQPIVGDFRIAVLSIKGGVGKTTTTFGLGSALATVRHDRVIAVDANPDRGTLGERVGDTSTQSTVRDLLSDPNINRYADVRNHTLMATSRLEVLASEQDPAVSEVFGADDYRRTVDILRHYYNIILTDCGTGIMHSAMSAVLDLAHTIVLVSSPAIDAARSASATLDWLMQHGHSGLVREAHVVLSASRPGSAALKLDKVYEHFQSRCRSIHLIPFDPHLAEGADVDFGRLNPATRQAYLELAGSVAENFGRLRVPREQS
ncbi:nucleotide-binding protein [Mycobacterium camsae]|uniref:nucleotide-binding protein n=1 Tax=Mycobacterium gordonae TaxID=1778 RepID=UPI002402DAC1|nr:AAA family ATPase [Mycobacterium gordonae]